MPDVAIHSNPVAVALLALNIFPFVPTLKINGVSFADALIKSPFAATKEVAIDPPAELICSCRLFKVKATDGFIRLAVFVFAVLYPADP